MLPTVRIGTSHLIERDARGGEILERLPLCTRATSLLLRATLTPLEMHVKRQREVVEKKRRGVPNGAANSVKLAETANTVDSLTVQLECLGRPASIQAWLRGAVMNKMHKGHDASPILVASDV
jgi:hypothetical protein